MDFQELREIPVSSEPIYNGRILDVQRWQVTCPNGNPAAREIVVHKGAAAVVPVYEDGTTLLVRHYRRYRGYHRGAGLHAGHFPAHPRPGA